jgi:hypothetical protein
MNNYTKTKFIIFINLNVLNQLLCNGIVKITVTIHLTRETRRIPSYLTPNHMHFNMFYEQSKRVAVLL